LDEISQSTTITKVVAKENEQTYQTEKAPILPSSDQNTQPTSSPSEETISTENIESK
jgi:hypothetical protein